MESTKTQVIDKASQKEKRRRLEFLVKLILFIGVVIWRVYYEDFLEKEYGVPRNLISAVVFYISAHIIISFFRLMLVAIYLRRHHRQTGFRNNFVIGINQIASLLSFVVLVFSFFFLFSINPKEFFTSLSIIAAAIAILSKDYISNMINGLIIMFSDQLSLNDYVKIGDQKGTITDITFINIHIVNDDEDLVYVPNNIIFSTNVVNYSKQKIKKATIEFEISGDKGHKLIDLEKFLQEVLQDHSHYIKQDSHTLKISKITKDTIYLKYQFVFQKENREAEKQIRKILPRKVIDFFREEREKKETV
jgi:small-conductance mechanosensitive channel